MDNDTKRISYIADEHLREMLSSGQYERLIKGMVCFGGFSLRNQALIHKQMPEATELKGMRSWNFFGRYIKGDEKGVETLSPIFEKQGLDAGTKSSALAGFKVHYLFDITQTEGPEYHSARCLKGEASKYFEAIAEGLEEVLSWRTKDGAVISHSLTDVVLKIQDEKDSTDNEKLAFLVANVADKLIRRKLGHPAYSGISLEEYPTMRKIMNSAVTHIILHRLNISVTQLDVPDMHMFSEDEYERFKQNLNLIRQVSQTIVNNVETIVSLERKEELKKVAKENYKRLQKSGRLPFERDELFEQESDSPKIA